MVRRLDSVEFDPETAAGRFAHGRDSSVTREQLETLIEISEAEIREHGELRISISPATDVAARRNDLNARIRRLQGFRGVLQVVDSLLDAASVEALRSLAEEASTARRAVHDHATVSFQGESLGDVGGESWRLMWEAARAYSDHAAYPGRPFPHLGSGAVCVLCQQALAPETVSRLGRFEQFVVGALSSRARVAEESYRSALQPLIAFSIPGVNDPLLSELAALNPEGGELVRAHMEGARAARERLVANPVDGWVAPEPVSSSPLEFIDAEITSGQNQLSGLMERETGATNVAVTTRYRELDDRIRLRSNRLQAVAELSRRQEEAALRIAINATDTTAVTVTARNIEESSVGSSLRDAFEHELQELAVTTVPVELHTVGGRQGETQRELRLSGAIDNSAPIEAVVSEGEHQAVALAGFLAEFATASHRSAIVLDDPVSSFDHGHRDAAAARLVEEGKNRQVIIFTHDFAFLVELQRIADERMVPLAVERIIGTVTGTGVRAERPALAGLTTERRIRFHRQDLQQARAAWNRGMAEQYENAVRDLYTELRFTWERAVEEILFSGVLTRFAPEVHTQLLPRVDIYESDCTTIESGMTRCSGFAHDRPLNINPAIPLPEIVESDIHVLDEWVREVKARRS